MIKFILNNGYAELNSSLFIAYIHDIAPNRTAKKAEIIPIFVNTLNK
jgi:hypothetical protein